MHVFDLAQLLTELKLLWGLSYINFGNGIVAIELLSASSSKVNGSRKSKLLSHLEKYWEVKLNCLFLKQAGMVRVQECPDKSQ